ncbi:hypothetical protein Pyn_26113 [Prunus yedoensis var. nudiflora]|uniref:Uncharacterized protein n=1 Tax=Prunus yedoensis var. nudiflora TaxID=2094558 RepID=A0A314XW63_PRUYE|nr:hypothetical protein Pyn_26113 [Prunus yedoensis var. nudiflora]
MGKSRMDSKGLTLSTPSEVIDNCPPKAKELHLLTLMIRQFGLVQKVPPCLLPTNRLSSWEVDVSQNQDAVEVPFYPWRKTTSLTVRPRGNFNAIDEDGRTWYDDSNLVMVVFIRLSAPAAYHVQSDGPLALTMSGVTALALTVSGVTAWVAGILP